MERVDILRTVARSKQLEAEERADSRRSVFRNEEFSDNPEDPGIAPQGSHDDNIDFRDEEEHSKAYRDEFSDDEDDVFRFGDGDEEEAISMNEQYPQRPPESTNVKL